MNTELLRAKSRKSQIEYLDTLKELEITRREETRRTGVYRQKEKSFWNEMSSPPAKSAEKSTPTDVSRNSEQLGRLYRLQSELKDAHRNRSVISTEMQQKLLSVQASKRKFDSVEQVLKGAVLSRKRKICEMLAEEIEALALSAKISGPKLSKTDSISRQSDNPIPAQTNRGEKLDREVQVSSNQVPVTTFAPFSPSPQSKPSGTTIGMVHTLQTQERKEKSICLSGTEGSLKGVSVRVTRDPKQNIHVAVVLPPTSDASGRPIVDKLAVESKLVQLGVRISSLEFESGSNGPDSSPLDYKRRKRNGGELYDEP